MSLLLVFRQTGLLDSVLGTEEKSVAIVPDLGLAHNIWSPGKAAGTELGLRNICRMVKEWILVLAPTPALLGYNPLVISKRGGNSSLG